MVGHSPRCDEEGLRDLGVGTALGGEPGDPEFTRGERIHPSEAKSSGASAGRQCFCLHPFYEGDGAAAGCDLEGLPERLPRLNSVTVAPQRAPEVCLGFGQVELRRRFPQRGDRRAEMVDRIVVVQQGQRAKSNADPSRYGGAERVREVFPRHLPAFIGAVLCQHRGERWPPGPDHGVSVQQEVAQPARLSKVFDTVLSPPPRAAQAAADLPEAGSKSGFVVEVDGRDADALDCLVRRLALAALETYLGEGCPDSIHKLRQVLGTQLEGGARIRLGIGEKPISNSASALCIIEITNAIM